MVALQEEATNHPKVRRSRAVRAERWGKRRAIECVRYDPMKANSSEPQETCRKLGDAEVQTTEGPPPAELEVSGGRVRTRAEALRSLAADPILRPDGGSRMTGDCHVRFCESRGAQSPRPLTKRHKGHRAKKGKRASHDRRRSR